jgi:hypothetical protein
MLAVPPVAGLRSKSVGFRLCAFCLQVAGERDVRGDRQFRRDTTGRADIPASSGAPPGLDRAVQRLQRLVGNRAVSGLVRSSRQLSRDPTPQAPMPLAQANDPGRAEQRKALQASGSLSDAARTALGHEASFRLGPAFTAFSGAVDRQKESIKSKWKADAELAALWFDLFFGLGAPVFSSLAKLGSGGLAKLATKVENTLSVTDDAGKLTPLITSSDFLKEGFKGVGKIVTQEIKWHPTELFGEGDIDVFASTIKSQFQHGIDALNHKIEHGKLTDAELISTYIAYDPDYADDSAYTNALKETFGEFLNFVHPIGRNKSGTRNGVFESDVKAAFMAPYGKVRLALISENWTSGPAGGQSLSGTRFLGWVPHDMESFAKAKTISEFGFVLAVLPESLTDGFTDPPDLSAEEQRVKADQATKSHEAWERGAKEYEEYHRKWLEAMKKEVWPF